VAGYNGSIQEEFKEGSQEQKIYFEEISDFLKKRLGASGVVIRHYSFRSRTTSYSDEQRNHTHRPPVFYPHVDNDPAQVHRFTEETIGKEEYEKAKHHRMQTINIWRPLGPNPITNKPLTLCDYTSIDVDKDVVPLIIRGDNKTFTGYTISCNTQDTHKWYYLKEMRSNEMFVFKIYDSKPDVAQYTFHTAFNFKQWMP